MWKQKDPGRLKASCINLHSVETIWEFTKILALIETAIIGALIMMRTPKKKTSRANSMRGARPRIQSESCFNDHACDRRDGRCTQTLMTELGFGRRLVHMRCSHHFGW